MLYPEIEPYAIHRFKRDHHQIYVEECGNPAGLPVLFLHGGPGSGCRTYQRRFFDPKRYRIILLDQRGAGRSQPQGHLTDNTTQDLLRDLEYVRQHLKVEHWVLFGGSWGATLALLYAQKHTARVTGMVLRGVFLARERDLAWFLGEGAGRIYPERWRHLLDSLPEAERSDPLAALYRRLTGLDELAQRRAAREWTLYADQVTLGDEFNPEDFSEHVSAQTVNQSRIELHYAVNRYFIEDGAILDRCDKLQRLPIMIIHGRRDLVCPPEAAFLLSRHLPRAELRILPRGGHVAREETMLKALVEAADTMAERLTA